MKIYNKTLPEIFSELPWPYKIVVLAGTAFIVFAAVYVPYALNGITPRAKPGPLIVQNVGSAASFMDPGLASAGQDAALVFSTLEATTGGNLKIETHVATSKKPCKTWNRASTLFESKEEETVGPDGFTPLSTGRWQSETPTIVYDPDDKGKEWKAYSYKYFWNGNQELAKLYGLIAYKYTSALNQPWSLEEWVLSANPQRPPQPYGQLVQQHLNNLDASLSDIEYYARPSVVVDKGVLLMSLSAFIRGRTSVDRIIMLASLDHGKTWNYIGTPLKHDALASLNDYSKIGGASLLQEEGKTYLAAVLGDDAVDGLGTFIFPFENLPKARLRHDKKGAPVFVRHIERTSIEPSPTGGGFAAYTEGCTHGVLTSELSNRTKNFQIFKTLKRVVD